MSIDLQATLIPRLLQLLRSSVELWHTCNYQSDFMSRWCNWLTTWRLWCPINHWIRSSSLIPARKRLKMPSRSHDTRQVCGLTCSVCSESPQWKCFQFSQKISKLLTPHPVPSKTLEDDVESFQHPCHAIKRCCFMCMGMLMRCSHNSGSFSVIERLIQML